MAANYDTCKNCNTPLVSDEISLNRKLISRNCVTFLCIDCLAEYFKADREVIVSRIRFYRENGCSLFK